MEEVKKSKFQFTAPEITKFDFSFKDGFEKESFMVKIERNVTVDDLDEGENEEKTKLVTLNIMIRDTEESLFYIHASLRAVFKSRVSDKGMEEVLFKINAPSTLLSYLRPMVSFLTAKTPLGSYDIPFLDFSEKSVRADG